VKLIAGIAKFRTNELAAREQAKAITAKNH
jgi:hypothetical protein